ncbi:hypothetical protein ACLK19_20110 [Escherichia coli]
MSFAVAGTRRSESDLEASTTCRRRTRHHCAVADGLVRSVKVMTSMLGLNYKAGDSFKVAVKGK